MEETKEKINDIINTYLDGFQDLGYEITEDIKKALLFAEFSKKNLIISGSAGTGKSTFIELFKKNSKKSVVTLAPTGVAAVNANGVTIHSFFKMAIGIANKYSVSKEAKEVVNKVDVIIIDEISMVRADLMDAVDSHLRILTGNADKPFGGIKIVAVGDLFQLPPVVQSGTPDFAYIRDNFYSKWFFSAPEVGEFNVVELKKIFRQSEEQFINTLNRIRVGKQSWDDLKLINTRVVTEEEFGKDGEDYIYLASTNKTADNVNSERLKKINEPSFFFHSSTKGDYPKGSMPAPEIIELKKGSQVMMLRNIAAHNLYNGQVGRVIALGEYFIKVKFGKADYVINKEIWLNNEYSLVDGKIQLKELGSYTQYPLKLAYSITIHKSQSKTYEKIFIDLGGGAFSAGQTYVALSRCKTLNGIGLKYKIEKRDIIVDRVLKETFL